MEKKSNQSNDNLGVEQEFPSASGKRSEGSMGETIKLYHGTALSNLDRILSEGIKKPSLHSQPRNWIDGAVINSDAIYLTKHAYEAMIWGAGERSFREMVLHPNGDVEVLKFVPAQPVVIFEVTVPVSSIRIEDDKLSSSGFMKLYAPLSQEELLNRLICYQSSEGVLRPSRYLRIPVSSLKYRTPGFRLALKFWDGDVVNIEEKLGFSYSEYLERDLVFRKSAEWKECPALK